MTANCHGNTWTFLIKVQHRRMMSSKMLQIQNRMRHCTSCKKMGQTACLSISIHTGLVKNYMGHLPRSKTVERIVKFNVLYDTAQYNLS
jgi:hypothetical protein